MPSQKVGESVQCINYFKTVEVGHCTKEKDRCIRIRDKSD